MRTAARGDAAALLAAWEAGAAVAAAGRGAAVLDVLAPAGAPEPDRRTAGPSAWDLPLNRLAALAAAVHAEFFGAEVDGVLACSGCAGLLEVTVRLTDLVPVQAAGGHICSTRAGLAVRSPTARDLVAAAGQRDGRRALLARCVTAGSAGPVDVATLAPEEVDEIDDLLEGVAADALPVLRSTCPDCGGDVAGTVDAVGLLWQRVDELAPRLLEDVARLASAFGWRERDVLGLSPLRRAAYLQLVTP